MTHSWLFTGPPGSGRSNTAIAFAAALQCEQRGEGPDCPDGCHDCRTVLGGSHADVAVVRTEKLTIGVKEVRELVREYVGVLGFTPAVRTHGPVDTGVPDPVREHLLSVLREAVSNLSRHAMAYSAEIELVVSATEVRLRVTDDGVGPRSGAVESGLRNARRRATELGGSFELTSRAPRGTSFVWRVPLS